MQTEYDRTSESHGKGSHDARFGAEDPLTTSGAENWPDNDDSPGHDSLAEPDLVLDERLTSAAAPFLYLLSTVLIAVAGYFVYLFFHG